MDEELRKLVERYDGLEISIYDEAERDGFHNEDKKDIADDLARFEKRPAALRYLREYRRGISPNVDSWLYRIYSKPLKRDKDGEVIEDPWETHMDRSNDVQLFMCEEIDFKEFQNTDTFRDWKNLIVYDLMMGYVDDLIEKYSEEKQKAKDPSYSSLVGGETNAKRIKSILQHYASVDEEGRFTGKHELRQEIVILVHALSACDIVMPGKWATTARVFCREFGVDFNSYIKWEAPKNKYSPGTKKRRAFDEYISYFSGL